MAEVQRPLAALILVADDTPSGRDLLRAILEGCGYQVIEAEDGEQVLELAAARKPAIIILDLMLPRLDGCATARELRGMAGFASTPLVALTAVALDSMAEPIWAAGFTTHLMKPIAPSRLRRCVARLLQGRVA